MQKKDVKFSVLMSIYKSDNPEWLETAVESVCNQTRVPDEVFIVVDGPIPEQLDNTLEQLKQKYGFIRSHKLEQNMGLGRALEIGLPLCEHEYIARMDSDDISLPDRFEKQLNFIVENDLDLVGGDIAEFCDSPDEIVSVRDVPRSYEDIVKYLKSRTPFNHVSVMMRKSKVLSAGNYQDMHYCEDYYLWCRMYLDGAKMQNMDEVLVKVRMNKDAFKRRGGMKYFKSQKRLFKFMKKHKIINTIQYFKTLTTRFIVHVLMPGKVKEYIYKKHLRKKTNENNA